MRINSLGASITGVVICPAGVGTASSSGNITPQTYSTQHTSKPTNTPTWTPTATPAAAATNTPALTPTVLPGLCWEAESGLIISPFQVVTGTTTYISQTVTTFDPTQGGRASYRFSIATPGSYVVSATINGPAFLSSFFVNIDTEPTGSNIWDAPDTQGQFRGVWVTWRDIAPSPVVFNLAAGEHELIIRGREADLLLDRLCVQPYAIPTSTPTTIPTSTATITNTLTTTFTSTPTNTAPAMITNTPTATYTYPSTNTPTSTPTGTPVSGPVLVGHVLWQGPPAQPSALQQLPVTLTLRIGATGIDYGTQNTDAAGHFTVSVGSLVSGTYSWRVKGPKSLANAGSLALTGGP